MFVHAAVELKVHEREPFTCRGRSRVAAFDGCPPPSFGHPGILENSPGVEAPFELPPIFWIGSLAGVLIEILNLGAACRSQKTGRKTCDTMFMPCACVCVSSFVALTPLPPDHPFVLKGAKRPEAGSTHSV